MKVITVSEFLSEYFQSDYSYSKSDIITAYSATNLDRFSIDTSQEQLISSLIVDYPDLKKIDFSKEVFLFVGAYERKGLKFILDALESLNQDYQFIIIGSPEQVSYIDIPMRDKIVCIKFTKRIKDFYAVCDTFLFPTLYEPFGLVLLEAAMMGMKIATTRKFVGASELLENADDIWIYEDAPSFQIPSLGKLETGRREKNRAQRIEKLERITWESTSHKIFNFIKNNES